MVAAVADFLRGRSGMTVWISASERLKWETAGKPSCRSMAIVRELGYLWRMGWRDRIELNPKVLVGKPVVRGTRLAVELILDMIASGVSEADMLANHPRLTHDDILACVAYAAEALKSERVYPLAI